MKKLVVLAMLLAFVGANVAIASDVVTYENKKGNITFNHKAHQERVGGDCSKCHEGTPAKIEVDKDYSINGRVENVKTAQRIAHYLHNQGHDVIVSLVSPYIDQREDFKKLLGDQIMEFYVHSDHKRERSHFDAIAYVPPKENFIDVDTTTDTPEQSLTKILEAING